jgi:uncharacterized protein
VTKIFLGALVCCAVLSSWAFPGRGNAQPSSPTGGPSFSCKSAARVEEVICHDAALAAADRRLAALYQAAKSGAAGNGSNQLSAQRQWLKDRDARCSATASKKAGDRTARDCLAAAYSERTQSLAVANLISSPRLALAELRAVAPKAIPYYEALLAYATIDSAPERVKAVEEKLAPLYARLSPEVRDGLNYVGKQAITARLAASSDAGFAQFFDIASMQDDIGLIWPCAVLIKRPGLIAGLGSIWGGAIDGRVPDSDCEETLPSPPELRALSQVAFEAQPPCEGTIRFSTGREYAMLEDAVRLRRRSVWQHGTTPPSEEEAAFRRKNSLLIERTMASLTTYYARYFPAGSTSPASDARTATNALITAAFGYCD